MINIIRVKYLDYQFYINMLKHIYIKLGKSLDEINLLESD